jgi:PAS domain S-box-containing protein
MRAQDRFGAAVKRVAFAIETQVDRAQATVWAVAALMNGSPSTTGPEFHGFAAELVAGKKSVQALEWVPQVLLHERDRFEAEARRDEGPGYTIREVGGAGELVPAGLRATYYPVRYVEPRVGNEAAVGFDLGSSEPRRRALQRAAEMGQPSFSRPVRLVQGIERSQGFLLCAPVYRSGVSRATGAAGALAGFAVGVLHIEDMIAEALRAGAPGLRSEMLLELVDEGGDAPVVFYSSPVPIGSNGLEHAAWRQEVARGGLRWALTARPTRAYLSREVSSLAGLFGVGVLIGFELLLALAITAERWRREKDRRSQAEFAQAVISSVAEGVLVADTSGRLLAVNEAARRVLGSGRSVLPPSEWSRAFGLFVPGTGEHVPTEDLPLLRALRGEEVPATEMFVRNALVPDGIWASVTGSPLRDREGALIGGVVVFRDISEQKRATELSRRLSSAVEQTDDAVFITDRSGVIEYVNPAFERTTGYGAGEAVGRTPRILKSGLQPPDYYAQLWSTLTRGEPFHATVINRKKSGEHFHAEQTITPMKDHSSGQSTHFVSVMRDRTERLKLEEHDIEMRLGASVQRKLFPQHPPFVPGFDIAGAVAPASATCGDYFDFIELPDGRLALGIADVSGHGVGAALIMTAMRAYIRSLTRTLLPPEKLAAEVNRLLLADLDDSHFVTMLLTYLDATTGTLTWINLGHPAGYVLDSSGYQKVALRSTCLPLGLLPNIACTPGPGVTLEPGDTLILLTDGILEAMSAEGAELGPARALEVVRSAVSESAAGIAARLIEAVKSFAGGQPQDDDLSVVVCKRIAIN